MGALLNYVPYVLISFLSVVIIISIYPLDVLFHWHPFLMTVGFVICLNQGTLILSRSFFRKPKTKTVTAQGSSFRKQWGLPGNLTIHYLLQMIGFVCAMLGFYVIYEVKETKNKEHFTTWHGYLGAITMTILYPVQILIGASIQWLRGSFNNIDWSYWRKVHKLFGMCAVHVIGLVVVGLGFQSNWFVKIWGDFFAKICGVMVCVLVGVIFYFSTVKLALPSREGRQGL